MSTLVLELRQGDMMVVNGAPIRFRNQVRIELAAKAHFLFGKQLMTPEMANTPAKRIYFALQTAYIGDHEERIAGLKQAQQLIAEFCAATTSSIARECLGRALVLAEDDQCYQAMKLARRVMRHEEVVMGLAAVTQNAKVAELSNGAMQQTLASRRYGATQQTRTLREQEADVFRRVNHGLKAALNADAVDQARAIADNRRLWMALEAAVLHPANLLPEALKGSILNLGRLIQKEMNVQGRIFTS